ncbi:PepSY1/2 domain-containing protein [Caproicibacter sp.]|uniref:PepSY1/2 domain-containing protein n=1 Tax=Caproicibacter sp. TaxID=2814884 RepID=UPI003988D98D
MKKRRIATLAIVLTIILSLGGATVYGYSQAERYKRNLQYGYTRSLSDLRDCVDNIQITLNKAVYANTATEQNGLAAKLMRESSMAKAAISVLPLTENSVDNVSKFITQVGDFSMSLSRKISEGEPISDTEYKSMHNLESYAKKLQKDLQDVDPDFSSADFNDSLKNTEQDFSNFPSMIYDGPFSDHIGQMKPKMTEGKKALAQGNAQNLAADFMGLKQAELTHTQDTDGNMPTYNFTAKDGTIRISVTKAGGYISEMANTRSVGAKKLDYKAASAKARAFLDGRGIQNMKETYYVMNDGICMINYAYLQDGILCYPDLIKVGVALDNGEIVRFQSTGYLMNHKSRTLNASLSSADAQKKVSSSLKVKLSRLALIPTPGLNEVLCWEFQCTGNNGDRVLVYISAKTGYEEDILILESSDNGVLAR